LAKESKELLLSFDLQKSLLGYSFYSIDDSNEIVFQIFFQFSEKLYVINCNYAKNIKFFTQHINKYIEDIKSLVASISLQKPINQLTPEELKPHFAEIDYQTLLKE